MCMDVFSRKLLFSLPLAVAFMGGADAQEALLPADIEFSTEGGFTYYGNSSRVDMRGLRISQGDTTIEADTASASGFDCEQSEWRLDGNVRITVGSLRIEGTSARFVCQDDRLQQFELRGAPATFESIEPGDTRAASGGANLLAYDDAEARLSLTGDAWLSVGSNEIVGCDLIFDVDASGDEATFWSGSTECDERIRIRISPAEDNGADDAPQPP